MRLRRILLLTIPGGTALIAALLCVLCGCSPVTELPDSFTNVEPSPDSAPIPDVGGKPPANAGSGGFTAHLSHSNSPVAPTGQQTIPASEPDWHEADRLCQLPDEAGSYQAPRFSSLWDRIRAGYALGDQTHPRIDTFEKYYRRHTDYLPRVARRSQPFLFHIVERLEARGMPAELALLPVVESAFDPFAYSHGRAAGMWQFIPGTGRQYGLKQNWWYDGRRDFIAATDAALDYLEDLHRRLGGDWLLALAAYNSGEGNVRKALRRNRQQGKATDFWSLKLPSETRAYVPQLLAVSRMVLAPADYRIDLPDIANQPYFEIVQTGSQIDLAQAASMAGLEIQDLYRLNAGFNRWATDPDGPHRLLVPLANAQSLREGLQSAGSDRVTWQRYQVKSGDSLITIARAHHTTVDVIRDNNNIQGTMIRVGDKLLIPTASRGAQHYVQSQEQRLKRTQERASGPQGSSRVSYSVRSGDSLWTISRRFGVSVRQLAKWNGMAPRDILRPKQKLVIWTQPKIVAQLTPQTDVAEGIVRKVAYRVRSGDSLARIASRFNLRVRDIVRWNTLDTSAYIHPGQSLTLYVDVTRSY